MLGNLSLLTVSAGLLAAVSHHAVRADETSPAVSRFQGDSVLEFKLQRVDEGKACGGGELFAAEFKSTDFQLSWVGTGIDRRFVALKQEVWHTTQPEGCDIP